MQGKYVETVINEIKNITHKEKYTVTTIYLGGGTPSILNPDYIKSILQEIKSSFEILDDAEITIEINPGTVNEEKLKKIQKRYGEKIVVYPMDLSSLENIKTFGENPSLKNCNIRYLINNAGFAKFCSYDDISIDESINMIDLNISGVVAMGLVCIPHMKKGSHILNIASQASFQPLPYQNIYSSTKAFVRNYTRALNVELREKGITATAVCPGWMKTGLYDRGIIDAKKATTKAYPAKTNHVILHPSICGAVLFISTKRFTTA